MATGCGNMSLSRKREGSGAHSSILYRIGVLKEKKRRPFFTNKKGKRRPLCQSWEEGFTDK